MKINAPQIQQLLNAVKNPNGIKLMAMYAVTSLTFFLNKLLRVLNY